LLVVLLVMAPPSQELKPPINPGQFRVGDPRFFITYLLLAAANSWAGHDKEAKEGAAQVQKVYPGLTVLDWLGIR